MKSENNNATQTRTSQISKILLRISGINVALETDVVNLLYSTILFKHTRHINESLQLIFHMYIGNLALILSTVSHWVMTLRVAALTEGFMGSLKTLLVTFLILFASWYTLVESPSSSCNVKYLRGNQSIK